jgi:argininosuccinate lyase
VTGSLVKMAEENGCDLPDLSLEQMKKVHNSINQGVYDVLGVYNSTASRASYGGTSPELVRKQIKRWSGVVG